MKNKDALKAYGKELLREEREGRKRSRKNDIRNKRASKSWAMSQWEM